MILPDARDKLRTALAALVDGKMSNDDFDDFYASECVGSEDRGVAEIGEFGWGLYSSCLPIPYRLKGRHAVPVKTLEIADRCGLFLKSHLEYEWPPFSNPSWAGMARSLTTAIGLVFVVLISLFCILFASNNKWFATAATVAGIIVSVLLTIFIRRSLDGYIQDKHDQFLSAGPQEVWPFFSVDDYQRALNG